MFCIIGGGLRDKFCCKKSLFLVYWLDGVKDFFGGKYFQEMVEGVKLVVWLFLIFLIFIFYWIIFGQVSYVYCNFCCFWFFFDFVQVWYRCYVMKYVYFN